MALVHPKGSGTRSVPNPTRGRATGPRVARDGTSSPLSLNPTVAATMTSAVPTRPARTLAATSDFIVDVG